LENYAFELVDARMASFEIRAAVYARSAVRKAWSVVGKESRRTEVWSALSERRAGCCGHRRVRRFEPFLQREARFA